MTSINIPNELSTNISNLFGVKESALELSQESTYTINQPENNLKRRFIEFISNNINDCNIIKNDKIYKNEKGEFFFADTQWYSFLGYNIFLNEFSSHFHITKERGKSNKTINYDINIKNNEIIEINFEKNTNKILAFLLFIILIKNHKEYRHIYYSIS